MKIEKDGQNWFIVRGKGRREYFRFFVDGKGSWTAFRGWCQGFGNAKEANKTLARLRDSKRKEQPK